MKNGRTKVLLSASHWFRKFPCLSLTFRPDQTAVGGCGRTGIEVIVKVQRERGRELPQSEEKIADWQYVYIKSSDYLELLDKLRFLLSRGGVG